MADKWTFDPQADNSSYIYVLKYMKEIWKSIMGEHVGINFSLDYMDYDIDYNGIVDNEPIGGMFIGQHVIYMLQAAIVEAIPSFIRTDVDLTTINNPDDWYWTYETFADAIGNIYAANDPSKLFRRYADAPSFAGGTEQRGYAEVGDFVCREIWEDIANCLKLLTKLALQADPVDKDFDYGPTGAWGGYYHEGYTYPQTTSWQTAIDTATTTGVHAWDNTSKVAGNYTPKAYSISSYNNGNYSLSVRRDWGKPSFSDRKYETLGFRLLHDAITNMPLKATYQTLAYAQKPLYDTENNSITYIFDANGDNVVENGWTSVQTGTLDTIQSNNYVVGNRWRFQTPYLFPESSSFPNYTKPDSTNTLIYQGYEVTDCWCILTIEFPYRE